MNKKYINLLLTFTNTVSLGDWDKLGILDREILLYKKLIQKGIKINLLTYGDKSDLKYSNILDNIKIIPIKNKTESKRFPFIKTILYPLFNYEKFKNIDIVKTNQMGGSWITWLLKIFFHKKIIVRCGYETFKNEFYEYKKLPKHKKRQLKLIFLYFIEWISYKLANRIILSNHFDKQFIIKHFKINPRKITIIPNFIETNIFQEIPEKKKAKKILFIGRLEEEKNLSNLIESFKYLPDYSLDIIGKGQLEEVLRKKVEELNLKTKIRFLGIFPNSQIPRIINQYHVFVLPSRWEGNPKVLLEAMSCGVACIGTHTPGIEEIIEHKKNGVLCNLDSKSIAKAIKTVYEDVDLRKILGKNAREYIFNNNSLNRMVEKELKVYKSLIVSKRV